MVKTKTRSNRRPASRPASRASHRSMSRSQAGRLGAIARWGRPSAKAKKRSATLRHAPAAYSRSRSSVTISRSRSGTMSRSEAGRLGAIARWGKSASRSPSRSASRSRSLQHSSRSRAPQSRVRATLWGNTWDREENFARRSPASRRSSSARKAAPSRSRSRSIWGF